MMIWQMSQDSLEALLFIYCFDLQSVLYLAVCFNTCSINGAEEEIYARSTRC